jgi:hypothetical protein
VRELLLHVHVGRPNPVPELARLRCGYQGPPIQMEF